MALGMNSNPYAQYKTQNVMTASPGELTLMLYDAAVRNVRIAALSIEEKKFEHVNESLIKAQAILGELTSSLRGEYEITHQLSALYEFITSELVKANIKKDAKLLEGPLELLVDLRDTWQQAIVINRKQQYGIG